MTREEEEAIAELKRDIELDNDFSKEYITAVNIAIKALEQKSILDKVKAEIEELDVFYDNDYFSDNKDAMFKRNEILQIIDKYIESEE